MRTSLFIGSRFGGDFDSPLDLVGNIAFFCRFCGEVFAKRVVPEPSAGWDYLHGNCHICPRGKHNDSFQSFTLPGEYSLGLLSAVLLAEEFLFNTGVPE